MLDRHFAGGCVIAGSGTAHHRVDAGAAVGFLLLRDELWRNRPTIIDIKTRRTTETGGIGSVVILLSQIGVIGHDPRGGVFARAVEIVHIAGIVFLPAHQAHRAAAVDRQVDEAFQHMPDAAAINGIGFHRKPGRIAGGVGLFGDDAHGAGL